MKEILITSSVLIAVLLLLRVIFAKKVSRVLIYSAWILVALRLLIPVQIGQLDFSMLTAAKPVIEAVDERVEDAILGTAPEKSYEYHIQHYIEKDPSVFIPEVQEQIQQEISQGTQTREEIFEKIQQEFPEQEILTPEGQETVQMLVGMENATRLHNADTIVATIWFAGIAIMAIWFTIVNLRHSRMLLKNREKLECDSPIPVYVSEKVGSPCLVGLFRPAIYLTPECAASEETMRHVLTHELTHYRHMDHIWSVVRCICLCVYWFDPLVWVAAWFSRRDCELACDEGALKRLGEEERIAYGRSLLDVVSHASAPANLMQTATAMNETKKQLKERVNFIVKKPKISLIAAICMVIVCAIVAGCAAAGPGNLEGPTTVEPSKPTEPKEPTKQITLLIREITQTNGTSQYDEIIPQYDEQWNLVGYIYDFGATTNREYELVVEQKDRRVVMYDQKGLMVAEYIYREDGKLLTDKSYNGDPGKLHFETNYIYDDAGRLVECTTYNYLAFSNNEGYTKNTERYEYDENGNLIKRAYFSQSVTSAMEGPESSNGEKRYTYDAQGLLVRSEYYRSNGDLYSYTVHTYDPSTRTVTENLYSVWENSYGVHEELDTVKTTRYDAEGRVVTITERDTADGYIQVTDYTYQTVEVPLDFYAPDFFEIPMATTNFWEGQDMPQIPEEDRILYDRAVLALNNYERHPVKFSFADYNGTYEGQDAYWVVCDLFARLGDYGRSKEYLAKFRAEEMVNRTVRKYSATNSQNDLQTTENDQFSYNSYGLLTHVQNLGVFPDIWLVENKYLEITYAYKSGVMTNRMQSVTVYEKKGGKRLGTVDCYYDNQGNHTKDKVYLNMPEYGGTQQFTILYSYDDQGRLSEWHTQREYESFAKVLFSMVYAYDSQGRISKAVCYTYQDDPQVSGKTMVVEKVEDVYTYTGSKGDRTIARTVVTYENELPQTQVKSTITCAYNEKGKIVSRTTVWQPKQDMQGNVIDGAKSSREEITYYYETILDYEF